MTREFRPRYILFSISSEDTLFQISRNDMIACLRLYCKKLFNYSLKEKNFFLTRFNGNQGILRCKHTEKESAIILLQSIPKINDQPVTITTIATSGTIKTLLKKNNLSNELKN
jgi:RNase P/RNase MRP subunit POP5